MQLDLSSQDSVRSFAAAFKGLFDELHLLVNSAAIAGSPYGLFRDPVCNQPLGAFHADRAAQ
jgi:NAD(P)-dependent dehydrogenase (short-subunit alcohol dehydrogenase family)